MTSDQIKMLNVLISKSQSHLTVPGKTSVASFRPESVTKMWEALKGLGFVQYITRDKMGWVAGHCGWWHEEVQVFVSYAGLNDRTTWTFGTDYEVLMLTDLELYALG